MKIKALSSAVAAILTAASLGHATSVSANENWIDRQAFYSIVHSSSAVAASFRGTPATTAQIGRSSAGAHAFDDRSANVSDAWWLDREALRESSSGR